MQGRAVDVLQGIPVRWMLSGPRGAQEACLWITSQASPGFPELPSSPLHQALASFSGDSDAARPCCCCRWPARPGMGAPLGGTWLEGVQCETSVGTQQPAIRGAKRRATWASMGTKHDTGMFSGFATGDSFSDSQDSPRPKRGCKGPLLRYSPTVLGCLRPQQCSGLLTISIGLGRPGRERELEPEPGTKVNRGICCRFWS